MSNPSANSGDYPVTDANHPGEDGRLVERTERGARALVALTLGWQCKNAQHSDTYVASDLDLSVVSLVPRLDLLDKPRGHVERLALSTGELIEPFNEEDTFELPGSAFAREFRKGIHIEPQNGRFYPRAIVAGTRDIQPGDVRPMRVIGITEDKLAIDLNHPLAPYDLRLDAQVIDIWPAAETHTSNQPRLSEMLCNKGPGMQARWQNHATDFFSGKPFDRITAGPDSEFYARPRITGHVDRTASAQIRRLYEQLLPRDGRVLDLMSSVESHLPANQPGQVTGLGMNAEEMAANPQLSEYRVHDLNHDPQLPFQDASFDAVFCSLSVEYLIRPFEVFAEVARVLKPNAPFALTFSNRWFPPKVINLWQNAHDFERPGIVLEYLLHDSLFERLNTRSIRGLPRPADDRYAKALETSDPVFAVWGYRCP